MALDWRESAGPEHLIIEGPLSPIEAETGPSTALGPRCQACNYSLPRLQISKVGKVAPLTAFVAGRSRSLRGLLMVHRPAPGHGIEEGMAPRVA